MQVEVITHYYNEHKLAQLFFDTYSFADKIYVFLDLDSSEESKKVLERYTHKFEGKIEVKQFKPLNGMDDNAKVARINHLSKQLQSDWIINVDFDEFIFALPPQDAIRDFLSRTNEGDIVLVPFWQIYRHKDEKDLDYSNLNLMDRCHGDPLVRKDLNKMYVKPIVVRSGKNIEWKPGNHDIQNAKAFKFAKDALYGSHWAMADPELAIERRYYGRTIRQSEANLKQGLSKHLHKLTVEQILNSCKEHENDPKLFDLNIKESRTSNKISILLPYIRPEGARRCIDAIEENAGIPESQYEIIAEEDRERIGCSSKLKQLVERSKYDSVLFLGDDTIPEKDFLKNALEFRERLPEKWGMVGLNDHYLHGHYTATHWLADKRLLTEVLDGEFFHTGYRHCFADNELATRCIAAGKYIFAPTACIDHRNPYTKKDRSLMDNDYKWAYAQENYMHDKWLFEKRRESNWTFKERN